MKGKRRIFGLAALLSILLAVPLVFSLGIVDFPKFSSESLLSTASVFVDPDKIIKDYLADPAYQEGNTFTVHVNISSVSDLFTWQVNLTCFENPTLGNAILNFSRIIPGEFLARSDPEQTSSEVLGWVVNSTDNVEGYSGFAETILGNVTGIGGNGTLVSIEFLIVGYGSTDLVISLTGTLPTTLLDSTGGTITSSQIDGYFRNKLKGDVDMDRDVDFPDFTAFLASWLKVSGQPGYDREADTDYDGDVDFPDFTAFLGNWLKSV